MQQLSTTLLILLCATTLCAQTITWGASPDESVTGYNIYYTTWHWGPWSSGLTVYDAGNVTSVNMTDVVTPQAGTLYAFWATAYDGTNGSDPNGTESGASNRAWYIEKAGKGKIEKDEVSTGQAVIDANSTGSMEFK